MPDPLWINASAGAPSYDATELRQAMALALAHGGGQNLGARSGVRPGGTQLQTSIAGSTITVQEGVACLYEPTPSAARGPYWVALPADEQHTLTAAHATNPRKDIVVLRVYDHDQDTSGLRLARSEYIAGTAAPSPDEPTVPAGAFRLATIDVPSVANGGPPAVTINHTFTVAAGGILPVRNSTEEAALSLYDGLVWARLDTSDLKARLGGVTRSLGFSGLNVQVFDADGTWTKPAGARSHKAEVQGGGGAGGAAVGAGSGIGQGAGGGGGGYTRKVYDTSGLNATEPVVVGTGGVGDSGNGNTGGNSTFKGLTGNGGIGGNAHTATTGASVTVPGAGGTASGGDLDIPGGSGGWGRTLATSLALLFNHGGMAHLGSSVHAPGAVAPGNAGEQYGSGGSGAICSTVTQIGGHGADGVVIVETTF